MRAPPDEAPCALLVHAVHELRRLSLLLPARGAPVPPAGAASESNPLEAARAVADAVAEHASAVPQGTEGVLAAGAVAHAMGASMARQGPAVLETAQGRAVLQALAALGPVGEIQAVRLLRLLHGDAVRAATIHLEGHARLALANRLFRNPRDQDFTRIGWAFETARRLMAEDPEEVLVFLDDLERRRGTLATPLQRELLRGRFGVWVKELLRLPLDEEQTVYMARVVAVLADAGLLRVLLRRLEKASASAAAAILEAVGRAGPKRDPEFTATASRYLGHDAPRVRQAALDALTAMNATVAMPMDQESMRDFSAALSQMHGERFAEALRGLKDDDKREALLWLTSLVHRLDGDWLEQAAAKTMNRRDAAQDDSMDMVRQAFREFVAGRPHYRPRPATEGRPMTVASGTGEAQDGAWLIPWQAKANPQGEKFASGRKASDIHVIGQLQPGARIADATYRNTTAKGVSLQRSRVEKSRFTGCSFTEVDFTHARFVTVRFTDCVFDGCVFEGCVLEGVAFHDCRFQRCAWTEAKAKKLQLVGCSLTDCDLGGFMAEELDAVTSRLEGCSLGAAAFIRSRMNGVLFTECRFQETCFHEVRALCCEVVACSLQDNRFHGVTGDSPHFLAEEQRARRSALRRTLADLDQGQPAPVLAGREGAEFMETVLLQWRFEKDAALRLQAFLAQDAMRRLWAESMFTETGKDFLALAPALVEASVTPGSTLPPLPCRLAGYTPDWRVAELMKRYGLAPRSESDGARLLTLEGLYTIGSIGTIAQSKDSDVDMWLVYEPGRLSPLEARALRAKLAHIEQWAMNELGVEAHFFLMDRDAVLANNFGFSDDESCGSTQAILLKEEFYRTATRLAGRPMTWWATPPRLSAKAYARHQEALRRAVALPGGAFLDLGRMESIPRGEFYGAALWQMVKALKSPFKSVLKLGLLEKYMAGDADQLLLCERIKEALLRGERDLWVVDAYAVLFREVYEHFETRGDDDALQLMRMAFRRKAGAVMSGELVTRSLRGYSFLEYFYPASEAAIAQSLEPPSGERDDATVNPESLEAAVIAGNRILSFLRSAYASVKARLEQAPATARVSPEDMLKMSRRIMARLAPAAHKVTPLPFLSLPRGAFFQLEFSWRRQAPQGGVWAVRGELARREAGGGGMEALHSAASVEALAAWLVGNGLWSPNVAMQATTLEPNVSLPDIQDLLAAVQAHFPAPQLFHPPVGAVLRPQQVTRLLAIVNLSVSRELKKPARFAVIYADSWGQLFCKANMAAPPTLLDAPLPILTRATGVPISTKAKLACFLPKRAQCPVIPLL